MDVGGEQISNNGYGYGSYGMEKLPSYPSSISISTMDKFLGHSSPTPSPQFAPTIEEKEREMRNVFGEFSPFSSPIHASNLLGGYITTNSPPPSTSRMFPLLQDQPNNYNVAFDEEDRLLFNGGLVIDFDQQQQNGFMGSVTTMKPGKGGRSSTFFIKGQWTEDEDSALIELVENLGLRKWAMIAKKLNGRTGKQCRERWQNHLRPDIKKESWTEEEEMTLVQTHQLFGNKWAEIAKQIPGRTENSIKNHWNATKRRHNSKRKNNKLVDVRSGKPKSRVLQDYIKKLMDVDHSEDLSNIDPSSLLECGCDDEILFMQKMFKDVNMNHPIAHELVTYDDQVTSVAVDNPSDHYQMDQTKTEQEVIMYADPNDKTTESKPLSSNLYMTQLLEEADNFFSSPFSYLTNEKEFNFNCSETNEEEMKMENYNIYQESMDMDLMEMVYAVTIPNQTFDSPLSR